jgi:hypothetical protein
VWVTCDCQGEAGCVQQHSTAQPLGLCVHSAVSLTNSHLHAGPCALAGICLQCPQLCCCCCCYSAVSVLCCLLSGPDLCPEVP